MPISASLRLLAAVAVIVPIASACAPSEPVATQPGTPPPVWTGSAAPTATAGHGEGSSQAPAAAHGQKLSAQLKLADGTAVATADFEFADGFATVTVETTTAGKLAPGFHGLHIHSVGKCEGDFTSAGAHLQVPGHTTHPASGDLSSLQVRGDGTGKLVTTTDGFTAEQLLAGTQTAIIIHEKADNFANIPAERYQQVNGTPGPDETTMATGDAGKRVACGVISAQ
ncbi:superoxide dismutase[Cu-Zn] [Mycobacterium sp. BMJ-28]